MTAKEFSERYPWKVDALVYVKKPDGSVVAESIYKDEDAAIPQPRRDPVSDSLKQHIRATMEEEITDKVRLIKVFRKFKSLLIIGPTGSGKTSLASAIAEQMGQPCSFYDCHDLIERWRNSASVNIQKIFKPIETQKDKAQTIVLDNLEAIIARHNDGGDNGVWALCSFLDAFEHAEHRVTIIGITNNNVDIPWKLPYRFLNVIHMKHPTACTTAPKPTDTRKPYAALARKVAYYSAIALASVATLYCFRALYRNYKSFAYKN